MLALRYLLIPKAARSPFPEIYICFYPITVFFVVVAQLQRDLLKFKHCSRLPVALSLQPAPFVTLQYKTVLCKKRRHCDIK